MMYKPCSRLSPPESHLQGVNHQLHAKVGPLAQPTTSRE
jgi:hypothetical protein